MKKLVVYTVILREFIKKNNAEIITKEPVLKILKYKIRLERENRGTKITNKKIVLDPNTWIITLMLIGLNIQR